MPTIFPNQKTLASSFPENFLTTPIHSKGVIMEHRYRVLFMMLLLLAAHQLYSQSYPNPQITSSFTPDTSCVHDDKGVNGSTGQRGCLYACEDHLATYCASIAVADTFTWTVVGGTIGGNSTVTGVGLTCVNVLWGPSGNGSISVVETDPSGHTGTDNSCVTIINSPKAIFTSSPANACLGTPVAFNDASLNAISWNWDFGDPASGGNNFTTSQNPTHVFSAPGSYVVTLIVFNKCGCSDTARQTITISNLPGPTIDCPSTVCAGTEKCYSTPVACAGAVYTWSIVGGTRIAPFGNSNNICVQWGSGNPQGSITLSVSNCNNVCADSTTVSIPIVPTSYPITGPTVACVNSNPIYSLPAWPGTCYNWTVPAGAATIIAGDSTNHIQVHWNTIGTFTISVSWHNELLGCAPGSATIQVKVKPEFSINGPTAPVCLNSTSSFTAYGTPFTPSPNFIWSATGGTVISGQNTQNATIQWTSPGIQTVTVVPFGPPNPYCIDTLTYLVKVVQVNPPTSITGPNVICVNGTYTYSTPPPPSGLDVLWSVTNGTIVGSSHSNPVSVTWGPTGPYSVSVEYVNTSAPFCASVPFTLPVSVFNVAAITGPGTVCMDQTVIYTAGPPDTALDFQWSILSAPNGSVVPNGSIVTGQGTNQISVLWHGPGPTTVYLQLTVCSTTLNLPVTINPKPVPTITATGQLCNPVTLTASPGYTSYLWSNGALTSSIAVTLPGPYTVTVTNAAGCTGTATINVPPQPGPTASISTPDPTSYCIPSPINTTFHALQGSPAYSYVWHPSGGVVGGPGGSTYTVSSPGAYYVVVTDANGCTATSNIITVSEDTCHPPPLPCNTTAIIDFTIGTPICNPVSFFDNSTGGVTGQNWNFGDPTSVSNTSNLLNPTHSFTHAGYFVVTYSGFGPNTSPPPATCAITVTHSLAIPLVADFSFVPACAGQPTPFTDHSTYLPPASLTYAWDFGDGCLIGPGSGPVSGCANGTYQNPTHSYNPGTYIVTQTVSNGTCTVTKVDTVTINPPPSAAFTLPATTCVGTDIPMTTGASGLTYLWQFGDAATSATQSTSHAYATTGTFTVTLTVTDSDGCSSSSTQSIVIIPPATGCLISPSGTVTLCPSQLPFTLNAPPASSYQWKKNGLAIPGPAGTAATLAVTVAGSYTVTVTDANGCKCTTPPVIIVINPKPIVNITVAPAHLVCLGSGPNFVNLSTPPGPGTYVFTWLKDGNLFDSVSSTNDFFGTTGTHVYTVVVTDTSTGCTDSASTTIVICNAPAPPVITPSGSTNICQGDSVTLTSSIPPPLIIWSTGATTQSITVHASGTYYVTYTDPGCGCKNSASITVNVFPLPDFTLFPFDSPDCCDKVCDTAHICAPKGYLGYQWLLNGVPIPPPVGNEEEFYPPSSGSYQLILTGPNGCTDTSKPYCLTQVNCSGTCVTPPVGMVAWWPLGDPDGGVLDTEIVANHNGVPKPGAIKNYMSWSPGFGPSPASTVPGVGGGKVGDALYFFGQNPGRTYVDVPHSSAITFSTSDFSIDAWVWIARDTNGIQPIVEKMLLTPAGGYVGYRLYLLDDKLTLDVLPSVPGTIQYTTPLTTAVWHHVVATVKRNSTPFQYKLYVDGSVVKVGTITSIGSLAETADLIIGGWPFPTEDSLQSIAVDELELFDRAIDSTDVASLYHAGSQGKCRACDEACEGAISGVKWYDVNRNGRFDVPAEKGLANWKISLVLCSAKDTPTQDTIAVAYTDSLGNYTFKNICSGEYCIVEEHRPGWKQTWPIPGSYHVTLGQNQIIGGYNFGNWKPRISILIGVGTDSVAFNPDIVYDGDQTPWPIVIAQLNPYVILFNGVYEPGTEPDLSGGTGTFSIRRRQLTNFSFSQIVVNDSVLSNGNADSVVVTLPADSTGGVTVGFYNVTKPDTSVRFLTFTADQLSQLDQAKVTKLKRGQKNFAANTADLLTALFKAGGKIIVGKAGQVTLGGKIGPYVVPAKQTDVFATLNTKGTTHTGTPRGIDLDIKGKLLQKLMKTLPATKQNNKLVADMMALEVNIAASDAGLTPKGFGDLLLVDSLVTSDMRHINRSGTVRQLADSISNIMTNWGGVSAEIYVNMDNIVAQINAAFSKPLPLSGLDTVSWMSGKNLKLNGSVELVVVPFLLQLNSAAAPNNTNNVPQHPQIPVVFALHQNYPNPFNPLTVLTYDLPVDARVKLIIYNTLGQVVRTLADDVEDAGFKSVQWNASDVASGVYFYRIEAVGLDDPTRTFTQVRKMVLVK